MHEQGHAHVPLTKQRREAFLVALASGLSVTSAAALAGVARRTVYRHRERDSDFAQAWEDAVEACWNR